MSQETRVPNVLVPYIIKLLGVEDRISLSGHLFKSGKSMIPGVLSQRVPAEIGLIAKH